MINAALEHTAAMAMSSHFDAMFADDIIDELVVFGREAVKAFLDNMVPIEVLDKSHHLWA